MAHPPSRDREHRLDAVRDAARPGDAVGVRPLPVEPPVAAVEGLHPAAAPGLRPHLDAAIPHPLPHEVEVPVPGPARLERPVLLAHCLPRDRLVAVPVKLLQQVRDRAAPPAAGSPALQPHRARTPGDAGRELRAALAPVELFGDLDEAAVVRRAGAVGHRRGAAGRNRPGRPRRGRRGHRQRIGIRADQPRHQVLTAPQHPAHRPQAPRSGRRPPAQQPRRDRGRHPPPPRVGELQDPVEALGAPAEEAPQRTPPGALHHRAVRTLRLGNHGVAAHPLEPGPPPGTERQPAEIRIGGQLRRNAIETRVDLDPAGGAVRTLQRGRPAGAGPRPKRRPTRGPARLVPVRRRRLLPAAGEMAIPEIRRETAQRRRAGRLHAARPALLVPDVGAQLHQHRVAPHGLQRPLPQRRGLDRLRQLRQRLPAARGGDHRRRPGEVAEDQGARRSDEVRPRLARRGILARGHSRRHDAARQGEIAPPAKRVVDRPDALLPRRIDVRPKLPPGRVDRAADRPGVVRPRMHRPGRRAQTVPVAERLLHLPDDLLANRLELVTELGPPGGELLLDAARDGGGVADAPQLVEALVEPGHRLPDRAVETLHDVLADHPIGMVRRMREPARQALLFSAAPSAPAPSAVGLARRRALHGRLRLRTAARRRPIARGPPRDTDPTGLRAARINGSRRGLRTPTIRRRRRLLARLPHGTGGRPATRLSVRSRRIVGTAGEEGRAA